MYFIVSRDVNYYFSSSSSFFIELSKIDKYPTFRSRINSKDRFRSLLDRFFSFSREIKIKYSTLKSLQIYIHFNFILFS